MERLLNLKQEPANFNRRPVQCLNLLIERFTLDTKGCLESSKHGLKLFLKALRMSECGDLMKSPQMTAISQVRILVIPPQDKSFQWSIGISLFYPPEDKSFQWSFGISLSISLSVGLCVCLCACLSDCLGTKYS